MRKMHSNIVGRHAKNKKLYSNILQISQEAKAMKMKYSDVIDATVGMLYHEEGKIFKYQVVDDLLHGLSDAEIYHYAPARGTKAYSEGIFNWVFGRHSDQFREQFHYSVIPTTGGSGAISNTFYNFNDFGQKVLLPNRYWTPYENIAFEAGIDLDKFKMYDENNHFNIADFKEKARKLAKEQGRLCVLLNDPCNNPTGLCMTTEDWHEVVATLNEISKTNIPVILIQDIAYFDYQEKDFDRSRDMFLPLLNLDPEILAVIIFSGSKTFSLYGFRIGAQIGLSKTKEIIDHFIRVGDYSVRGRFSSVSQPGMNIIGKIFSDKIYMEKFQNELVKARKMLNQRSAIFVKEAEKQGLKTLPYLGGFFISVETANQNIFQDLVNEHVFVIPMEGLVRIAVSSLNREEIPRLVSILKKHI